MSKREVHRQQSVCAMIPRCKIVDAKKHTTSRITDLFIIVFCYTVAKHVTTLAVKATVPVNKSADAKLTKMSSKDVRLFLPKVR